VDKKDTVTFDIPLLIRVLERLINMRDKGMLTMDDYDEIAAIKEEVYGSVPLEYIKEALNQLKEEKQEHTHVTTQDLHFSGHGANHTVKKGSQMRYVQGSKQMYVHLKNGKPVTKTHPILSIPHEFLKSVNEDVELEEEFKKGDRVKHKDGTLGTVTREPDEHGIVSWKHAGNKHRVSHKSVLKSAAGEKFRWRKYDEEVEQTDESYFGPRGDKLLARSHSAYDTGDKETGKRAHTLAMKAGEKYRSNPVNRAKATREIMAGASADYNTGRRWTGDSVEYPEDINVVSEVSDATLTSYKEKAKKSADTLHAQGQYKKSANRWLNVMKATGKQMNKMKFENTLDPKAATEAPCDCG